MSSHNDKSAAGPSNYSLSITVNQLVTLLICMLEHGLDIHHAAIASLLHQYSTSAQLLAIITTITYISTLPMPTSLGFNFPSSDLRVTYLTPQPFN